MAARPYLSIVIPVFNEAANVAELHQQLTASLEPMGRPYEILIVDDGSTDGTLQRLVEIEGRDRRVRVLRLRRNFGQTAAFSAGFDHARGEIVVTSDGDLQNDPADIPRLVARLEEGGFDLVCGWRKERQDPLSKKVPSWFANRLISWATGVHLSDYGCSLKAIRAEVVRNLRLYGEMHRFIPAVASWMGVSVAEMPVNHRPRTRGQSKYGLGRTTRVLLDLFTVKFLGAYGTRPSHSSAVSGSCSAAPGSACWPTSPGSSCSRTKRSAGGPAILGALAFVTGLMFVMVGLLAEMLVRIYHEPASPLTS
jgi:glycosyltransferase involved in cell wall biosynthesis